MGPADNLRRLCAELVVVRASGTLADHQRRYPQWELPNRSLQELLGQLVARLPRELLEQLKH